LDSQDGILEVNNATTSIGMVKEHNATLTSHEVSLGQLGEKAVACVTGDYIRAGLAFTGVIITTDEENMLP
jgi:hypothetical protein